MIVTNTMHAITMKTPLAALCCAALLTLVVAPSTQARGSIPRTPVTPNLARASPTGSKSASIRSAAPAACSASTPPTSATRVIGALTLLPLNLSSPAKQPAGSLN